MGMIKKNQNQIESVSKYLLRKELVMRNYQHEFPNSKNKSLIANFHAVVEVLDHDFYKFKAGKVIPSKGIIDNKYRKGSDFLSIKLKRLFETKPLQFHHKNLKSITKRCLGNIFTDEKGNLIVDDIDERYQEIMSLANILEKKGGILKIIETCKQKLISNDNKGFFQILEKVKGFGDEFNSKLNILVKALELRNIVKFKDFENKSSAINYQIILISLRMGLITVLDEKLNLKLRENIPLDLNEEKELKNEIKKALGILAKKNQIDIYLLDDLLWNNARTHCQRKKPFCQECLFKPVCKSQNDPKCYAYQQPILRKEKEKILIINSGECAWKKCIFCGFGKIKNKINLEKLKKIIKSFFCQINPGDTIAILNSGSFFDDKQIPKQIRKLIYSLTITKKVNYLIVESRPEFIDKKELLLVKKRGINLKVGFGLEVADDELLKKLNKGFSTKELKKAIKIVHEMGHKVRLYILANAPFTSLKTLEKTILFAKKYGDDLYIMNCVSHKNTLLEHLNKSKKWTPWNDKEFLDNIEKYKDLNLFIELNNEVIEDETFVCA
ncbi:MAG: hypothetical protein U9Q69_05645 [Nanoarchaeota archaeon]|nr:hypothetical protein [Nanoarchaeota archaeon]